jgi:hypothetical protein
VGLDQWLCGSGSRSVLGTRAVAVWWWIAVRVWYWSSGCVVEDRGPCVELHQWLYSSGLLSVRGTRTLAVW